MYIFINIYTLVFFLSARYLRYVVMYVVQYLSCRIVFVNGVLEVGKSLTVDSRTAELATYTQLAPTKG